MLQTKLIYENEWDILIILDACRYDYFARVIWNYLKGHLVKVIGLDSHTLPWVKKTFGSKYYDDIVYVSANPFINSKVVVKGFHARRHFLELLMCGNGAEIQGLEQYHHGMLITQLN